jgi:hypothetical protein
MAVDLGSTPLRLNRLRGIRFDVVGRQSAIVCDIAASFLHTQTGWGVAHGLAASRRRGLPATSLFTLPWRSGAHAQVGL